MGLSTVPSPAHTRRSATFLEDLHTPGHSLFCLFFLPSSFPMYPPSSIFFASHRLSPMGFQFHSFRAGGFNSQLPCKSLPKPGNFFLLIKCSPFPAQLGTPPLLALSTGPRRHGTHISYGRKGKEGGGKEKGSGEAPGLRFPVCCEGVDWVWQGDKGQGSQSRPLLEVRTSHSSLGFGYVDAY